MQATLKKIEYTFSDWILVSTVQFNVQGIGTDIVLRFSSEQVYKKAEELGQTSWDLSTIRALCSQELGIEII